MKVYVDIDETICRTPAGLNYALSVPIPSRINKINSMYAEGHTIVYWTARGTETGIDWRNVTEAQLENWGALYHELHFKKPTYDIFICDKAINSESFFQNLE